ncbi:Luciferin 4-monooxygenase [Frankliniella fusca]|uniref:Luciferin 4-monooxygenase n=1 Tax=Frankliniella fusca TaxID=407009 RepID=A0AAE1HH87_9NEOP|nr:Luciferin 4-monooxygenase [Frankliniella fusca]
MTYRELVVESVSLARALRALLLDAGDAGDAVTAVFVENRRELLPSLVANLLLGVPVTMLNPLSNTGELVRAWTSTKPCLVLCSWSTLPAVQEAAQSLPFLRHAVVFPRGTPEGDQGDAPEVGEDHSSLRVEAYTELLRSNSPEKALDDPMYGVREVLRPVQSSTHTAYLLQCGRGGRIARLTHRNLQYTVQLLHSSMLSGCRREPDAAGYGWTADDVLLLGAPLSHAFGLGICLGALALGLKVVIMQYFREQLFLSAVQTHQPSPVLVVNAEWCDRQVSQLVLVPRQAELLAHSPLLEDAAVVAGGGGRGRVLRGLRGVVCAAAPLPRALHRDLTRRLDAPCRQAYGLTQASCSLLVAPRGAPPDTQGRVVPGAEAKVVDAVLRAPLGPLQVGELYLRAPSIMAGYVDHARAQDDDNDQDEEGWLRTGDLAYYDRNECVFVVDRLKDVTMYTRGHFKEFDVEHD